VRKTDTQENHGIPGAAQPQPNEKLDTEKERTELTTEYTEHTEREPFHTTIPHFLVFSAGNSGGCCHK
jgi:hypothetical protein